MTDKSPLRYDQLKEKHPRFIEAVENLGKAVKESGPIAEKDAQLIQLAAAAAIRSEGAVHSHARRAMQAGATASEVYQALMLLVSTVGFPTVVAAISWVDDVVAQGAES